LKEILNTLPNPALLLFWSFPKL